MIRYAKRKDDEFVKLSIGVRRDIEGKMKIERDTLTEALTRSSKRELEAAVDRKKIVCIFKLSNLLTCQEQCSR